MLFPARSCPLLIAPHLGFVTRPFESADFFGTSPSRRLRRFALLPTSRTVALTFGPLFNEASALNPFEAVESPRGFGTV